MRALVVLAFVLQIGLLFRPLSSFVVRPFFEDTFYSLSVSYWMAEGKGMSIDGVHHTNGVQPLICFLYLPSYWLTGGDRLEALVPVLATQIVLFMGAVFAIASCVAGWSREPGIRKDVFWLVAMLASWSVPMRHHMLNGLETGLAVGVTFASVAFYNRLVEHGDNRWWRWGTLGGVLGIGVLTRIDIGFLVGAICVWHWLRPSHRTLRHLRQAVYVGLMAAIVSLPWWVYNVSEFGSLMPISGQAQIAIVGDRATVVSMSIAVLVDAFVLTFHTPANIVYRHPWVSLLVFLLAVGGPIVIGKSLRMCATGWRRWRSAWELSRAVPLVAFAGMLIGYYTFIFGSPHFNSRYLLPERILVGVLIVTLTYEIYKLSTVLTRGLLVGAVGLSVILTGYYTSWDYTGRDGNATICRVEWIERNCTKEDRIAMFQSGTAGYLCANVTNLDGKVNETALRAIQNGTMSDYLIGQRFDVLMDWGVLMDPVFKDTRLSAMYTRVDRLKDMSDVYRLRAEYRKRN